MSLALQPLRGSARAIRLARLIRIPLGGRQTVGDSIMRIHRAVPIGMAVAFLLLATCAPALDCVDQFDGPDGTLPDWWRWTGDPEGGGSFAVEGGALTHTEPGAVHYVYIVCEVQEAWYSFDVEGSCWDFAWNIWPTGPSRAGKCLRLSHDQRYGEWAISLADLNWQNLDSTEYPDGFLMWHNATEVKHVAVPTGGPLTGWHNVQIDCPSAGVFRVRLDGVPIIDETWDDASSYGNQGFGCTSVEAGTPALDNLVISFPDPVEPETWGMIKALYR